MAALTTRPRRSIALVLGGALACVSIVSISRAPTCRASTGPTTPTFVLAWGNAGPGPGQLQDPIGVATDALGNVYVADTDNHRIQKFDRLGNFLLQWGTPGTGNGQFQFPYGLGTDVAGNVYVADTGNHRVQKFTSTGGYLTQWGGNGEGDGQFLYPQGVAADADGNVYVGDTGNHLIQKFTSTGVFLTQWGGYGSGNGQLNNPVGVATDAAGAVYVADYYNHRIVKFTGSGVYLTQWGGYGSGPGQFSSPTDVGTDAVGNVYVADQINHRIQKFTAAGTFITAWGSFGYGNGQFRNPTGVDIDAAGNVYVVEWGSPRIQKFSGAGAALSDVPADTLLSWGTFGSGPGQFYFAFDVATDASGSVYVSNTETAHIEKFTATGTYITQWGSPGTGNGQFFQGPICIATDPAGNVIATDETNNRVQEFTSSGAFVLGWSPSPSQRPLGVSVDPAGGVFLVARLNNTVGKFTETGDPLTLWGGYGGGQGQFRAPFGVASDAVGSVYVADEYNYRVQKFTGAGAFLTQWRCEDCPDFIDSWDPLFVAADALGNVYVTDHRNHRVAKFTGNGAFLAQWSGPSSGSAVFSPDGIAVDGPGNLYVVDEGFGRVRKFIIPPTIALVSDVPNDQGRQVRIRFLRCSGDAPGTGAAITGYEIYRRVDSPPGWTYLTTIAASGAGEYTVVVPTLVDATAASLEYSAFKVRAITSDPLKFYDSSVENGYSIDNLPPPTPSPFTATFSSGVTHLHWGVSSATDFAGFRLYRGASAGFVPSSDNLVVATPDTGYADVGAAGSYYKLSAIDNVGHESGFALVGPGQTTDVPGTTIASFALEGPRPNPARDGRMAIHFALPAAEPATLELFDVTGRRVASRPVGSLGAGRHMLDLTPDRRLPVGMYLVRLTQGVNQRMVRVLVLD